MVSELFFFAKFLQILTTGSLEIVKFLQKQSVWIFRATAHALHLTRFLEGSSSSYRSNTQVSLFFYCTGWSTTGSVVPPTLRRADEPRGAVAGFTRMAKGLVRRAFQTVVAGAGNRYQSQQVSSLIPFWLHQCQKSYTDFLELITKGHNSGQVLREHIPSSLFCSCLQYLRL